MAVTTQESTEYANAFSTSPAVANPTSSWHGRLRIAYFTCDQSGAGDATSSVALCKLPAGKVRVFLGLSKAYVNWTTASATLDLGWDAYTNPDGVAVTADPDGLVNGLAVDTVNWYDFLGTVGGTATTAATGGTYLFDSQDGVVIRATSQDTAIVDGDDLVGYIVYAVD